MKNIVKTLLQAYRIVKQNASTKRTLKYEDNVSISPDTIVQGAINYDFRVTPEDRKYIVVGKECLINNVTFTFETQTGEIKIGNNCYLGGVHFICRTKIEVDDDVMFSWGITLYDHDAHSVHWEERKNDIRQVYRNLIEKKDLWYNKDLSVVKTSSIHICSKAWIGFDVLILKGVTVGEGAVVAAKSIVTKDVPPWTVVAGNPAKTVKILKQ